MPKISFDNKIKTLNLPEDIENESRRVHSSFNDAIKGMKIESQVFLAVTEAYKIQDKVCDTATLRFKLGILNNHSKALLKDAARHGYRPIIKKYTPQHFLENFCHYIGIPPSHYSSINRLIDLMFERDPSYHEVKPQEVAAGIILYYAFINGFEIDPIKFAEFCKISISSLNSVRRDITAFHNDS